MINKKAAVTTPGNWEPALPVVGVTGLEPAAFCSQSRRATNCATPRIKFKIIHFLRLVKTRIIAATIAEGMTERNAGIWRTVVMIAPNTTLIAIPTMPSAVFLFAIPTSNAIRPQKAPIVTPPIRLLISKNVFSGPMAFSLSASVIACKYGGTTPDSPNYYTPYFPFCQ